MASDDHTLDADERGSPELSGTNSAMPEGSAPELGDQTVQAGSEQAARDGDEPVKIGRFVVLKLLGSGGMGTVYSAYDEQLDRRIAIKLLHGHSSSEDSMGRSRLRREAQAMAKLSHPNVAQVYEVGVFEGQVFLAMELVKGRTLTNWLGEKQRPWPEVVDVFVQAGRGLAAAHAVGLIHRDFKPDNVMVARDGRVRVLDFGLVRASDEEASVEDTAIKIAELARDRPLDAPLTATGAVMGTPKYMSPEQYEGRANTAKTDQFSFCVALYEGLYGERPFAGDNWASLAVSVVKGEVRKPPAGTKVPTWLRRVVLRGLEPDAADRHASMDELLTELGRDPAQRRRRFFAVASVAAVVAGAFAGGELLREPRGPACAEVSERLAGIWDDARKRQVHDALLATGLPYAEDTWARVEGTIDSYAEGWVSMQTEACEATRVHLEQSAVSLHLEMACLENRLTDLRALVDVLGEADAAVTEKAVQAASSLKPLGRCADVDALSAEIRPPGDPEVAAKVEHERGQLARAKVLEDAGKYTEGLALAQAAAQAAKGLDYRPLEAEALLRVGHLQEDLGEYAQAEKTLAEAYWIALATKHDDVLARSASVLVSVVGNNLDRPEEGLEWGRHAKAAVERIGLSGMEEAALLSSLGAVFYNQNRVDEARDHFERSLAIREKVLGKQHPKWAGTMRSLGLVLLAQGEYDEAREYSERALATYEKAFGPEHPEVAHALIGLGSTALDQGRFDEAHGYFERTLAIYEKTFGPEHVELAWVLLALANADLGQGQYDRARGYCDRALAIYERTRGPDHSDTGRAHGMLAAVLLAQGDLAGAREHHEHGLAVVEKALGPEHPGVGGMCYELGKVLLAQGEHDKARAQFERALSLLEGSPDPVTVAYPLTGLGRALLGLRRQAAAVPHLERALSLRKERGVPAEEMGDVSFALARALWESGKDRERAKTLAREARDKYDAAGKSSVEELAEVEAWLARHGGKLAAK